MSMGKGKNTGNVGKQQQGFGTQQQANYNSDQGVIQGQVQQDLSTAPGQMNPASAANYGSTIENIDNTYQNLTQSADKQLGARGFGNAPSGFAASINNNIANQKGNAITGAYRTGLEDTQAQKNFATSLEEANLNANNPNAALSGASSSYTNADKLKAEGTQEALGLAEAGANLALPGSGSAASALGKRGGGSPATDLSTGGSSTADALLSSGAFGPLPSAPPSMPPTGFGSLVSGKYANVSPFPSSPAV